jgi:hypothetical protein
MKIILVFVSVFITLFTSSLDAAHRESNYNAVEAQSVVKKWFEHWTEEGINVGNYPAYFDMAYAKGRDGTILAIQPIDGIEDEVREGFTEPSLRLLGQVNIKNPSIKDMVSAYTKIVSFMNSEEPNIHRLYYMPREKEEKDFSNILLTGFNRTNTAPGLAGTGIYLSPDPLKANDYSPHRGKRQKLRAMFLCQTTLGKVFSLGVGRVDRELVRAPVGHHSIQTFLRRSTEHVVYHPAMLYVTSVIFYYVTDSAWEMTPPTTIPPKVRGKVFFISVGLSEFLNKIQERATKKGDAVEDAVREAIGKTLRGEISAEAFIGKIETALKAPAPKDFLAKLKEELEKSGITQTQPAAADEGPLPMPPDGGAEGVDYIADGGSQAAAPVAADEEALPMPPDGGAEGVTYVLPLSFTGGVASRSCL